METPPSMAGSKGVDPLQCLGIAGHLHSHQNMSDLYDIKECKSQMIFKIKKDL